MKSSFLVFIALFFKGSKSQALRKSQHLQATADSGDEQVTAQRRVGSPKVRLRAQDPNSQPTSSPLWAELPFHEKAVLFLHFLLPSSLPTFLPPSLLILFIYLEGG